MCVSMAVVMMVAPAFATEVWDPHLRGVDTGLAAGALPPPGFYFVDDSYMIMLEPGDAWGHRDAGTKIFAFVEVPILLWVPGCKFLGADYGVAIAQPFDYTNLRVQTTGPGSFIGGQQWGTFNTLVLPYILSWKLPCDFYVKTALIVGVDDAWTQAGDVQSGGPYAPSGNGYWSFQPEVGISWLHAGWNLSADFFYSFNLKNTETDYQSGQQFAADYTITYTWKKWTFGLGAAQENQTTNDTVSGSTVLDGKGNAYQATCYSMGPIVGYNFGPCSLQFTYEFPLAATDELSGPWWNVRLVVPLGKLGM